ATSLSHATFYRHQANLRPRGDALGELRAVVAERVVTGNTILHPTNAVDATLAAAVRQMLAHPVRSRIREWRTAGTRPAAWHGTWDVTRHGRKNSHATRPAHPRGDGKARHRRRPDAPRPHPTSSGRGRLAPGGHREPARPAPRRR